MGLSAILQSLYNLVYGPPPPELPQEIWEDAQHPPQPTPQLDAYEESLLDQVVGSSNYPVGLRSRENVDLDQRVMGRNVREVYDDSGLRSLAKAERDLMIESFKRSRQAQSRTDKAAAVKSAREHERNMQSLNKEASEEIFRENNKRNRPGIIDLHDLYVEEAIRFTDRAIQEAIERKDTELRLIVGQGRHSAGGMPKLKPAILKHLQRRQLAARLDPRNAGMFIVRIGSEKMGESPLMSNRRRALSV